MTEAVYGELAGWWPWLRRVEDADEEAAVVSSLLSGASDAPIRSLLDLGCGAAAMAPWWPEAWALTLVDRSPHMLREAAARVSRATCVEADLTTLRLDIRFDAVLLHDAVMYLTDREALAAAWRTVAHHLRPGGVALVMPDDVRETFAASTVSGGAERPDGAGIRLLEWRWDPDPTDDTVRMDLVLAIREGGVVRTVHDTHTLGVFPEAVHAAARDAAGLVALPLEVPPGLPVGPWFLARRRVA